MCVYVFVCVCVSLNDWIVYSFFAVSFKIPNYSKLFGKVSKINFLFYKNLSPND